MRGRDRVFRFPKFRTPQQQQQKQKGGFGRQIKAANIRRRKEAYKKASLHLQHYDTVEPGPEEAHQWAERVEHVRVVASGLRNERSEFGIAQRPDYLVGIGLESRHNN